jgi:hypothetical protein
MKNFVLIVAVGLVVAFTTPAFAGDTEADCQKAGGTWDAKTNLRVFVSLRSACSRLSSSGLPFA